MDSRAPLTRKPVTFFIRLSVLIVILTGISVGKHLQVMHHSTSLTKCTLSNLVRPGEHARDLTTCNCQYIDVFHYYVTYCPSQLHVISMMANA